MTHSRWGIPVALANLVEPKDWPGDEDSSAQLHHYTHCHLCVENIIQNHQNTQCGLTAMAKTDPVGCLPGPCHQWRNPPLDCQKSPPWHYDSMAYALWRSHSTATPALTAQDRHHVEPTPWKTPGSLRTTENNRGRGLSSMIYACDEAEAACSPMHQMVQVSNILNSVILLDNNYKLVFRRHLQNSNRGFRGIVTQNLLKIYQNIVTKRTISRFCFELLLWILSLRHSPN